jgi:hypothetical protein
VYEFPVLVRLTRIDSQFLFLSGFGCHVLYNIFGIQTSQKPSEMHLGAIQPRCNSGDGVFILQIPNQLTLCKHKLTLLPLRLQNTHNAIEPHLQKTVHLQPVHMNDIQIETRQMRGRVGTKLRHSVSPTLTSSSGG